jgi:hypothetical protein
MDPDDDEFDARDLMELIRLAAYLQVASQRGKFPKARFQRYSDTLMRLVFHLAGAPTGSEPLDDTASSFQTLLAPSPCRGPATVLTHPRFRGRRKREKDRS